MLEKQCLEIYSVNINYVYLCFAQLKCPREMPPPKYSCTSKLFSVCIQGDNSTGLTVYLKYIQIISHSYKCYWITSLLYSSLTSFPALTFLNKEQCHIFVSIIVTFNAVKHQQSKLFLFLTAIKSQLLVFFSSKVN